MLIDSHVRRLRPERLKVSLDIVNDGGPTHAIKVYVEDGNSGAVGIVGRLILDGPVDRNLFAIAGIYHVSGEHDDIPLAVVDGVDA